MNFSRYSPELEKDASDSAFAPFQALSNSFSELTILMPFPPPPAVAFNMTGYPKDLANLLPSFIDSTKPSEPGTVGIPAFFIVSLAVILSPILSIISQFGPINFIPLSLQIFENSEFSDKKPYPG